MDIAINGKPTHCVRLAFRSIFSKRTVEYRIWGTLLRKSSQLGATGPISYNDAKTTVHRDILRLIRETRAAFVKETCDAV